MSHSVDRSQQHLYKYVELYQLRQSAIASTLHSNFAQPVVAAKNFAAAIINLKGGDSNLKEAQELASLILEMTDQAYTVAYDLMRENEANIAANSDESMKSIIEQFGALLRLNDRGIKLLVFEDMSSVSVDRFVQIIIIDWIKALLIYLTRHTKINDIVIKSTGNNLGLSFEITSNVAITAQLLESELVFIHIRKQLQILTGSLRINGDDKQSCLSIVIPFDCGMVALKNE